MYVNNYTAGFDFKSNVLDFGKGDNQDERGN